MRIGIDLGGTKIEGIVMDSSGAILHRTRCLTPIEQGYEAVVKSITDSVLKLEQQVGTACTVGIGTPGAISTKTGLLKNSNATCLNGRPLYTDLQDSLRRPIRMANDANCFTLSEALDGAAAGYDVVFGVILGTGVGGGISFAGRVHGGPNSIAGEWGHAPLLESGPACYCGKKGCVETLLSGPGMLADYRRLGGTQATDATTILALAENGSDPIAAQALKRYMTQFGRALANIIDILDPDAIVIGGGLSNMNCLYEEGPKYVAEFVFSDALYTPILKNVHGAASGVRGAAMLW